MFRSLITEGCSGPTSVRDVVGAGDAVDERQRFVLVVAGGGNVVRALVAPEERNLPRRDELEVVVVVAAPG
jgi:hypothetical protein